MNKDTEIHELLKSVQNFEGNQIQMNEPAILAEYHKKDANKTSLAIKILSIIGGVFATQVFLGFLSLMGLFDSNIALLITGFIFVIAALFINRTFDKVIFDTLSISIYVAGLVLIGIGMRFFELNNSSIALVILVIASISLIVNQTYILSFMAVLTVCSALLSLIIINKVYGFIHAYNILMAVMLTYVILNEAKIMTTNKILSKLYNPIRIGLIFSLLLGLIVSVNREVFDMHIGFIWISSILMLILVMYLVAQIIEIIGVNDQKKRIMIYALTVLVLSSTIFAPSILGAILIILLCFLVNYKTGFVIGIIALIYFFSQYYYDLSLSLLNKSIILISSGILFLVFYVFINKKSLKNEKI